MEKYTIEFNKEQLRCLVRGVEFYSRFLAGQWEIPWEMQFQERKIQGEPEDFWSKRNYVEDQLEKLKSHFTGLPQNAFYGIGSDKLHEDAKISYDIYRPILEELVGKSDIYNVYSSPGLTYSKQGRIKDSIWSLKEFPTAR